LYEISGVQEAACGDETIFAKASSALVLTHEGPAAKCTTGTATGRGSSAEIADAG